MASRLLKEKSAEEILAPKPRPFEWDGERYEVYPMPDAVLMHVGGSLSAITGLFDSIADLLEQLPPVDGQSVDQRNRELLVAFAPLAGQIIQVLLPNATAVIAGCLRLDPEQVASGMGLAKKLEALRLIVEAEDIPLILKNAQALTALFTPSAPKTD